MNDLRVAMMPPKWLWKSLRVSEAADRIPSR
jgi:hypothetical protein